MDTVLIISFLAERATEFAQPLLQKFGYNTPIVKMVLSSIISIVIVAVLLKFGIYVPVYDIDLLNDPIIAGILSATIAPILHDVIRAIEAFKEKHKQWKQ